MDDNDFLTLVTQGIKLKDVEPENVRGTPSYSGIQLTEGQQAAKDREAEAQADNISVPTSIGEAVSMQIDSLKDDIKSTAIYRNIFGNDAPDETRLANSEKLGSALGISPQILASNPKMYDTALIQYDRQRNAAFLDNKPFTPTTLSDMYPELDMDDPVAVTMALKDSNAVLKGRTTIAAMSGLPSLIANGISDEAAFIKDNWNAGRDIDEASNIKYDLYTGNIDLDTALNKLKEIESRPEMQNEGRGPNYILGQTIRMNSQMARNIADGLKEIVSTLGPQAAQYINQIAMNAGAIGTMGTAAAAGAIGLTGTAAAVPIGVAGAAAGIGLGTLGILVGTYKAQVGDNYLQYISEKNPDGTRAFTNAQARAMARRDAALQAIVETGVTNYAYGAVGSVFSMAGRKVAAKEAIRNAGAMKKVIKAGTDAFKKSAKKAAAKKAATQFAKATASEVAEEGIQSAISDIDERISGYQGMTYKKMFDDATEAMWQALPAVVGTMLPGSLIHGAGAYVGINKLSQADFEAARTMMERSNEKGMIDRLLEIRDNSSLFKNSPKTYAATVQNQLEKANMGTVYIDAQTAAENPQTHAALNQLVSEGAITEKQLNESITTGKPLEIESGKYMQAATPEMNTALENYRTLDKGERTIHDLQEIRNRAKELRDLVQASQKEREAMASQKILDEHFKGDTEQSREDRATMAELLSGGLTDLKENAKNALDEAVKDWTDKLPNAREHVEYIRKKQNGQGTGEVGIIARENDSQGGQWETARVSSNEGWYSDAWKQKGSMPTQRDILDYDHDQYLKELESSIKPGDAEGEMEIQSITEAKKRVESLERVNDIINSMDKDDIVARTLLDTETYDKVYKPYLAQIQAAAKGTKAMNAAKDSALILAKIAENLNKNYGIPLEKSLAEINGGDAAADKTLGQYMSPEDQLKIDARYFMDQVNKALAGDLKSEYIRVMRTPLIMKLIGAKILPITLSANKLKLVLSDHSESINKEFLRQIPEALADPMMVFKTYNGKNGETRKVFVIDVKDKHGATVVIPVELDTKTGEYHVNRITSIYGKNDGKSGNPKYKFFKANIERGNVEYVNKKKTAAWYSSEEVYSSIPKEAMSSLLNSNLPNENDLVKLKEESPAYYQMAGGHAINAPINKLVEAGRMRDEGETPEEIWNKTGWMIGPDHMWRFEIPDNLDKIRIPKDNGKFALSEIYDNPALYEAYPELANRQVSFKDIKKTEGGDVRGANGYVNANGEISIDSSLSEEEAKSTLVHEIQHTIQRIEGFSEGGSPNRAKKTIQDQIDDLIAKISEMESESKDVFDYIGKALQLEEELNNYSDDDAIGWIKRTKKLKEEKEKMFKELPISKEKKEKLENLERDIDLLKSALSQDDYAAYRRLGGEAEAFMTEGRAYSQTDRQRDIEYNKRAQQRKARFEKLKKVISKGELEKLETLGKLEEETEEYRKQPDHDRNKLIKMIKEADKIRNDIPVEHYIIYASAIFTDKPTVPKDLPIPNYNTQYGPAVINFAGDFYPLSTSTPDLVVYHNVNERNLESAISLGGLPMPSLAITKKDMDFGDFGDITLIGDKNMVDPRRSRDNEVFSRDAYTVRKPIVNYEQPSEAAQEDFRKKYSTAQKELKRQGMDVRDIDFSAYDGDQIITRFKQDPAVRYYYVKKILGKDVTVKRKTVYPEIRHNSFFESYPEVLNLLDSEKVKSGDYAELDKAVKPYFDELQGRIDRKERFIGPVKRRIRAMTTDGHLNGEGVNILQKWKREYQEDQKEKPYDVIDEMAFHNDTQKAIEQAGVDKFNDYLQKEFENLHEEKFLWDNGKKYKFNVDNIVKLMKKYRGTNNEGAGGINYGFNSLLAYLSHRFTSISDIKSRESTLQPNAKELKQYKKAESMFDNLCKEAVKLKGNADESVYIDLAELIKDIRDGKENNLHGFPENKEFVKNINSFLKEADKVTTDYFEAKPARKVEFSEFSGAVVPNTLQKKTVDYLKSQGIEVVTYNPNIAGDRQAKTRDLGSELNVYFQSGGKYQGAYDPERNAIELFDGANQSTVIHEGAHMYLSILERMENLTEEDIQNYFGGDHEKAAASMQKVKNDLSTIREWAAFSDKHLEEYKGTSLEKEFLKHAEDIRNGVEGAEEVWMQERFARGFEKYLMDGSAPTKEMKGVFRRFKSWLADIYKTAKSLGKVKLTPDIRGIYDHMIATDREIEAWAAQRKLDSIDKAMNVNETEAENFKRWSEEVKEKAKEVALSFYMKTMKNDALENFRKSIDTEENRRDFEKKLAEENPLYMIEQLYNSGNQTEADKKALLKMNGLEEKDFLESVKAMGGTTKERWNRHIEEEVQNFQDNILTEQDVRSMAESVLESPEGLQKRSQIEAHLLEKRVNQYIAQVTSSQLKLKRAKDKAKVAMEIKERLGLISSEEKAEMGRQAERITRDEDKIQKLEERVKKLKDRLKEEKEKSEKAESRNKTSGEVIDRLNGNIKALQNELEKERAKSSEQKDTITDSEATVADLESQLNDMVEGLKESRKAMRIDYKLLKDDAAATLGEETVSHATSWKWWENKARIANVRSMKAMERNDFEEAAYQKQVETQDILMSRMAKENIDEIKHALHGGGKLTTAQYNEEGMDRYGILGILNRIGRKEKPVLMNDDARYFVQHLAYMAGLTNKDGELPLDDKGLPREFDWGALNIDLNPDAALGGPNLGKETVAPWMKALFNSKEPKKMMDLKMNDLRWIFEAIKAVYKIGRREYEGNTLGTSFDNAAAKIQDEIMTKWTHDTRTPLEKVLRTDSIDRAAEKFHKLVKDITLPEILIERMGKEFYQYVYVPIDKASAVRRKMKQDANKKIQNLLSMYSRKEWTAMRSKKSYTYGYDSMGQPNPYTKEQVICMALNMGTQSNRARLIERVGGNEAQMLDFLDKTLDKRDWDFVEGVWSHINEYWGERNKIQNDLYGTPMGKVPGMTIQLRNGRTVKGMYYPIKYDRDISGKTNERVANEIAAEDLQGISAFALGMGSTKSREKGSGEQFLRLDLDVYPSHISEAIQHVSMREATVDVFKLLSRKEVVSTLERTIGTEGLSMMRQWVSDNWHSSIIEMSEWNGRLNRFRHNYAFATMGYRVSTAILNVLNIFGMMDRMGPYNALKATADFYFGGGPNAFRNVRDQYRFITQKSTYMRERAANMDRDMALGDKIQVGRNESEIRSLITHGKYGIDKINSGAFKIMAWTDEMFSLPEWMATYKGTMRKLTLEGKLSQEEMNAEAVRLADKAVRETFGSGEVKDQTAFMRQGDWLTKMTSFFSYTNLVTNQFIRAGYEMYDHRNIKPLLTATLFWWLLNGFFEACLRELWDDSKDDDKWRKKLIYVMASGGPLGGVPVIREALPSAANYMAKGGKGQLQDLAPDVPALGSLTYLGKALQSYYKGDTLETGRNINKAVTRSTPFSLPDTIVDGYWNFLRLMSTDSHTLGSVHY